MAAVPATYTAADVAAAVKRLRAARERAGGPACASCGARESLNVREAESHLLRVSEAVFSGDDATTRG